MRDQSDNNEGSIAIIGLGYVGLPTSIYFAMNEFQVIGIDVDEKKIDYISKGVSPIKDPFIDKHLDNVVKLGTLKVSTNFAEIEKSEFIIITVPTPINNINKKPDLSFIESVGNALSKHIKPGQVVILESTVYPGVTENFLLPLLLKSGLQIGIDFDLAYCPERFNPGDQDKQIKDTIRVIGANNEKTAHRVQKLYSKIQKTYMTKDILTAEASKVIENTQRDLNIALMNEIALICEKIGIDVYDVIEAADTKWNFIRYNPGPGVGGHCLPHDPYYLVDLAKRLNYEPKLITAGRELNDEMPNHMVKLLEKGLNTNLENIKKLNILIMGATYKPNIDDIRTSPTEKFVEILQYDELNLSIHEPNVHVDKIFGAKNYFDFDKIPHRMFDAIIFMVEHSNFRQIKISDYEKLFSKEGFRLIVDGYRLINKKFIEELKINYIALGAGNN